jgi:hypothetical protein
MAIDIHNETLLTFGQAARRLNVNPATLWRWRTVGVRGVKLETVLCGGRRRTSAEALQRFSDRITAVSDGEPIPSRTARQRERAFAQAEREIADFGIQ